MVAPGRAAAGRLAERRPLVPVALGATLISASGILIQLAGTGPATTAFFRCLLALPVLVPLLLLEQRRLGRRPARARLGAVLAGAFLAVDFVLWNHTISDLGAGVATVIGNLQVLFVAAAAWLLFRERPQRRFLIALPVVLTGVALVSGLTGTVTSGIHPLAGIGYGAGTSLAYAGFLLVMRRTSARTPHVAGPLAEATASAGVTAVLLAPAFGGVQLDIGWPAFGWLLMLALSSQTVGWLLITSGLPRLPAAITSLVLLLQPAAAMFLAAIVLDEQPTVVQVGGAVAVCAGVVIATRTAGGPQPAGAGQPPEAVEAPADNGQLPLAAEAGDVVVASLALGRQLGPRGQ
jgi:drug/metabolite transporter (DMT)-like permease